MNKRYSEYTAEELQRELVALERMIGQESSPSQAEILRQKYYMAKSYLLENQAFPPGEYRVEGREGKFTLERLNGVMAWGRWNSGEEGAVPIATLIR
jgi:hypothetical protein